MRRFRFSIAKLMVLVVCCAVGIAALRSPTLLWYRTITTLTLFMLGLAAVGLLYQTSSKRAFWVGFALFGWGYWIFALSPWIGERMSSSLITTAAAEELSTRLGAQGDAFEREIRDRFLRDWNVSSMVRDIDFVKARLNKARSKARFPDDPIVIRVLKDVEAADASYEKLWVEMYPKLRDEVATDPSFARDQGMGLFVQISHNLFTWIAAIFGGIIALYFHHTRSSDEPFTGSRTATGLQSNHAETLD